ncbi:hypothetical protein QBC34DRAFT_378877 [Podospora aff. communis PSN243]|uniref:3-carboxymuconate cyclase n=1 Tax=Podospora aff. communis PSN243 TaxID=3040156 RepID=A0AAV9GSU0_9PEZI|nr:hypothetical protein QBC34DRAFT_378877 [Podospora aff. communis PSN243]
MAAHLYSFSSRLALLILLGFTTSTAASPTSAGKSSSGAAKALYFLTNDTPSNAVVSLQINPDGLLSLGSVTPTNGSGSVALNSTNQPATPDALVSQSALALAGTSLFAVNAGSNTLTMLSIDPSNPTLLTALGDPLPIPGDFPNTVAASSKHNLICVGTTGIRAGISCTSFSPTRGLLRPFDTPRPLGLNQTTPPVGPTNTLSHVFFSADESALFATVKGDPATNKTGSFSSFSVLPSKSCNNAPASVSTQEIKSIPSGTAVLFGSRPIPGSTNRVFATDASFGAVVLDVDASTGEATARARGEVAGQVATCWVAISEMTGTAFVTDVGVNRVVEMGLEDARVLGVVDMQGGGLDRAGLGLIDLVAEGGFVYALAPGDGSVEAAVAVVDVLGRREVQRFGVGGVAGRNSMGMVVWG